MNFFPSFLNHKKTFTFVFLFFVIFGFMAPNAIAAVCGTSGPNGAIPTSCNNCVSPDNGCKITMETHYPPLTDASNAIVVYSCSCPGIRPIDPDAVGKGEFGWTETFTAMWVAIVRDILWFSWRVATWISDIFSTVVGTWTQNLSITKNGNFTKGWVTVRDFANMLIVLGFVIIGIATTLRIREYEAKKFLGKLIVIALLVNFSGLFCGLIIDAANIAFKSFTIGSGTSGNQIIHALTKSGQAILTFNRAKNETMAFTGDALMYSIAYIAVALTYIYLSLILIARYAILAMLYILSPVAFVFWAFPFPKAKDLWNQWWSHFLKWAFVGVIAGFFLNIASSMLPGAISESPNWTAFLLFLVFLFVGFKITAKSSGLASMAAGAVIGLATGGAGLALGAVGAMSKGGLKMAGRGADAATGGKLSAAGQKISSGVGRAMENIGLRKAGTTALSKSGELGESEKRYSALVAQGDLAAVQRTARGEGMNKSPKERAGAAAALLKSNNFDTTNAKEVSGLSHFQSQGGNLSEYSKKDPRLSRHDVSATRQTMAKNPGMSEGEAQSKNVDTNYSKLGVRGMRDLSSKAMDLSFIRNTRSDRNGKASDEYSADQIEQQKKFVTKGTSERASALSLASALKKQGTPEAMAEYKRIRDNLLEIKHNPNFS